MAIYERRYQKVSFEQLKACLRWCQNTLHLRDWEITLYEGQYDSEKKEGFCLIENAWQERASIWVGTNYCKEKNTNPYRTVCHEVIHVLITGKCRIDTETDEVIARTFEDMLYEKFCRENKIKIVPFQEN
jgi:hypothetical protein